MRVSQSFSQQLFLTNLRQVKSRLDSAMAQMSSGVRVRYGSDDPEAAAELVKIGDEAAKLTMRRNGLSQARPWLQLTEQAVTELGTALGSALTYATQGASSTVQPAQRQALAAQIDGLIKQAQGLENSQISGHYVFSGTKTDTQPYDAQGNYQGNDSVITIPSDNVPIQVNVAGDTVFGSASGGAMKVLTDLRDALRNGTAQDVQALLDPLHAAILSNSTVLAQVGNQRKALEDADVRLGDRQLSVQTRAHDLGAADMAQAISDVAQYQQTQQATLAAGARLYGPTFFNFLG